MNQAYTKLVKAQGLIQVGSIEPEKLEHLNQLYDNVIQNYIRDARRSFDVKVFKAKVWCKGKDEPQIHFFTNRLEIGSMQQSERLGLLHEFLESDNKAHHVGNLQDARQQGLMGTFDEREAFSCSVECRVMDQMGKQHDIDIPQAMQELPKCSYIKLINVPSAVDISGTLPDPTDGSLSLAMIDHATINLISRFCSRTHLTADLSHANPSQDSAGARHQDNIAVGNYHYDEGSCASLENEENGGRILDGGTNGNISVNEAGASVNN